MRSQAAEESRRSSLRREADRLNEVIESHGLLQNALKSGLEKGSAIIVEANLVGARAWISACRWRGVMRPSGPKVYRQPGGRFQRQRVGPRVSVNVDAAAPASRCHG